MRLGDAVRARRGYVQVRHHEGVSGEGGERRRLALVNLPSVEALDAFVAFCAANQTAVAPAGGPPACFLGPPSTSTRPGSGGG